MKREDLQRIEQSVEKLESWIRSRNFKGYDPFDGLQSYLRPLTFHNLLAERILQQSVRHCPVNLRPVLGIKPQESPIGRGYMASGYLRMLQLTKQQEYKERGTDCLDWLVKHKSPFYYHNGWGNHFDYVSRTGSLAKYEPTIVWTSLIGQSFLDACEALKDDTYLSTAKSINKWIAALPREKTGRGSCLSYVANEQSSIHNSNMLGSAMLARSARFLGNGQYLPLAKEAMEYSCSRQLPNGAWYYGEAPNLRWIDNFHTGYNLESLKCYITHTGDKDYRENLIRGFRFFKNTFFEESGRPRYYHNRVSPTDIQCVAQAIETLSDFRDFEDDALEIALRVALWAIENMQDKAGYFYYRIYPLNVKATIPMIHWGQATMFKSLAVLLNAAN